MRSHHALLGVGLLFFPQITTAAPFAFITLANSDVVSRLDIPTNTALTIPVGTRPAGLAVSPDGNQVYVANWGDSTISVVDISSSTVIGTIPVAGPRPLG